MRRLLLGTVAIVCIGGLAGIGFFSASKYRVSNQAYLQSLSDFLFMLGSYHAEGLGLAPPRLSDASYQDVMAHVRSTTHYEVENRVTWSLVRWGDAVAYRLIQEIESSPDLERRLAAARALAELAHLPALPVLAQTLVEARSDRRLEVDLIDALVRFGPEAAPLLIDSFEYHTKAGNPLPYTLMHAIGQSRGASDFLLAQMAKARSVDEIRALQWPLAMTGDVRAARVLAGQLRHAKLGVRQRARDSMSQYMSAVAADPVAELLERETDDYVRSWAIRNILASRGAARSQRAVELLGRLLDDPIVSSDANYALARMGSERAIELLRERAQRKPARWALDNLEYTGTVGLRIVSDYLDHPDAQVRRAAVWKLLELDQPEALQLLATLTPDPDPLISRAARDATFRLDLLLLEQDVRDWFTRLTGQSVGRLRPPNRAGVRNALAGLGFLQWTSLALSLALGLALLAGWLRAFESYRFALVLQFLLVAGLVGDFFFLSGSATEYRLATSGRLLLLLGLLFLRDDPLPGETRGRLERLAVRSLWVLIPLLLVFGGSQLAEALRHGLRDWDVMKWALLLLGGLTLLVVEQALLPWGLFARGGRVERGLTFAASCAVIVLFAVPMGRWVSERASAGQPDRAAVGALLILPLLGALAFHWKESRLLRPAASRRRSVLPRAPRGLRIVDDGDSLLIRLRRRRRLRGLPSLMLGGFLLCISWWLSRALELGQGGGAGMFLLIVLAVFGTALSWLVLAGLSPGYCIQLRNGAARSAASFLGGTFGRPTWRSRLRIPALLGQLELTREQKDWIATASDRRPRRASGSSRRSGRPSTTPQRERPKRPASDGAAAS